jgi:DNA-binding CsgD family transcriptional regulator
LGLTAWQVLASLGDSMAVVDRTYRVVWCNDPLLARYKPGVQVIGRFCYEIMGNSPVPCERDCPVSPLFATGRPQRVERHFVDPEGVERWREARSFPIVDKRGRIIYAVRISFDITRRKKADAQRQREQENLERALGEMNRLQLDQMPFQPQGGPGLTRRELEVLRLLAQGLSKPTMAEVLGISPNTVKRHVVNIFNKLGVNDRAQAAVWAARRNLV